ncbi:right-handed parallel beta-helix repeat-containing protein [Herbiconiux sp. SYSU D00978]|uniref:right-handed parallel beta-helix repeat-containing protein n=1 Tax=Herbiconiux sp. SYSU D00978 TaxID=2812562 RepID=UPI001A966C91|nr:right-handed parallel beta-helix repeat-containing protein [Herbiconiux sp. SYSU D00978]
MRALPRPVLVVVTVAAALVLAVAALAATRLLGSPQAVSPSAVPTAEAAEATPSPVASGTPGEYGCPAGATGVSTSGQLQAALDTATPGSAIELAPGHYVGRFTITASGTSDQPIRLCGSEDSVLDGGDISKGYVLHLDGVSNWILSGFSVRNGQKGVMADATVDSVFHDLAISHVGDEALHLRRFSTGNIVSSSTISDTGLRKPQFGEGIYIGTAESNWCDISDCEPDRSDGNTIEGNVISGTTAESVDIKEGTSGGVLRGNSFDGTAIVEADSWVDVKGNDWLIEANIGEHSPLDGFQTHEILDGWGTRNHFAGNTAVVNGPGFGFSLTPLRDNVVSCSNKTSSAGEGSANTDCTP